MYVFVNPNPRGALIGDCAVRALSIALGTSWDETYLALSEYGFQLKNLPNADSVWGEFLKDNGYTRRAIPDTCPACYTVRDFCAEHPQGVYVLGTGSHVIAVIDGDYYDSWDSGDEVPIMYWRRHGVL